MAIDVKASFPPVSALALDGNVDWYLVTFVLALMSFGLVMVASASIDLAAHTYSDPWFFVKRHAVFLVMGAMSAAIIAGLPSVFWNRLAIIFLLLGLALLIAVLIPGVGKEVNGSRRWLGIGPLTIQASEAAKFCFIIFFASFLARRMTEFREGWSAFFKLLIILGAFVVLLLLEPDFGSSVVLCITAAAMMFIAGVPILRFLLLAVAGVAGLAFIAVASPYRWQRLVTFLDPWADQFSSGYQLVQSLIAFGRGEWLGLGLGNSLQKLFFLPEAHTDFIFSIIAEEFGLFGALIIVLCFAVVVTRILKIALRAYQIQWFFALFCSVGIATLFAAQAFINMGVASGLLPTKGLTLPFVSSGGSSLLVSMGLIALVLRFDWEMRTGNISDVLGVKEPKSVRNAGHKKTTKTKKAPQSRTRQPRGQSL